MGSETNWKITGGNDDDEGVAKIGKSVSINCWEVKGSSHTFANESWRRGRGTDAIPAKVLKRSVKVWVRAANRIWASLGGE